MVAYASNTSTGEMKIEGSEVQDHAQPNTKFKVNLGYMRSSLKICFLCGLGYTILLAVLKFTFVDRINPM